MMTWFGKAPGKIECDERVGTKKNLQLRGKSFWMSVTSICTLIFFFKFFSWTTDKILDTSDLFVKHVWRIRSRCNLSIEGASLSILFAFLIPLAILCYYKSYATMPIHAHRHNQPVIKAISWDTFCLHGLSLLESERPRCQCKGNIHLALIWRFLL